MAAMAELDSFIVKYKQLWKKGCDVTLTLKSEAGKASVSLNLSLDDLPGATQIQQKEVPFSVYSNSRDRRRKRRETQFDNVNAKNNDLTSNACLLYTSDAADE